MMTSSQLLSQKEKSRWEKKSLQKLLDPEKLKEKGHKLRDAGLTIATVNGSFDLMHAGHLYFLYEASLQADCLIVALNTDESIQKNKRLNRPIIPLKYRLQMMSAIEFVDYMTYFEESTPCKFLEKIKPDVHVNGSEYGHNCIEAPTVIANGGKIHIVKLIDGLSSSKIIEKITQCV